MAMAMTIRGADREYGIVGEGSALAGVLVDRPVFGGFSGYRPQRRSELSRRGIVRMVVNNVSHPI
jgi:hypothetical protein